MYKKTFLFFLFISQFAFSQPRQNVLFEDISIDSSFSFRGLSVVNDSVAWVSGQKGIVGKSTNSGKNWFFLEIQGFQKQDFRTLYAFNEKEALIANAGSPAHILRTSDGGLLWDTVYSNNDTAAFIDGVDFWNDKEGIVYGDPIKGKMLLLKTADGGKTWKEIPGPVVSSGEASFAASGTGIRCYGNGKVIIATGGKVSRLLVSKDKGVTWEGIKTPIKQGMKSTGIFSFAFQNDTCGIIVGGDYLKDSLKQEHIFYTTTAGKSWKKPYRTTGGYRECVEFMNDKTVLAVGPAGTDVSYNSGKSWDPISNQRGFHVVRKARKGNLVIAAGKKRISVIR